MSEWLRNRAITFIARWTGYCYAGIQNPINNRSFYGVVVTTWDGPTVYDPMGLLDKSICFGFGGRTIAFSRTSLKGTK
jgi:hypothetical protein